MSGVGVRVHIDGLDRHTSAGLVQRILAELAGVESWWVYPTANGTLLGLSDATFVMETLTQLAQHLDGEGFAGSIVGSRDSWIELASRAAAARPTACSAALAFTMDVPYQDGPRNEYGHPSYRWGVTGTTTRECVQEWVDWAVPERGRAVVVQALADVSREDALDVLLPHIENVSVEAQLLGSPEGSPRTRAIRARMFGEAFLTDAGSRLTRLDQAHDLLHLVLNHARHLDYATVRVNAPNAHFWSSSEPEAHLWAMNRHLWPDYVADANGIQILTNSHLQKARDLTNWHITPIAEGRSMVQAKDLTPWFGTIDELKAQRGRQYLSEDLRQQARYDFGDMLLTEEVAAQNPLSPG